MPEIKGTKNSENQHFRVVLKKPVFPVNKLMVAFTE
jgi:hypothetical protein